MRVVIFHGGGNFRHAAETMAQSIRSASASQGVEVKVYGVSRASQVRNALKYGQLHGSSADEKDSPDAVHFFTHSGPHGIYLSNQVGAPYNLAVGRTFLDDSGSQLYDATPYSNVFNNLSSNTVITIHGCKYGMAKHGRSAGAQELADATSAIVNSYVSGSFFTHDISLASGARMRTRNDFMAHISGAEPVWMVPSVSQETSRKTFWPAGSPLLPEDDSSENSTGDAELDRLLDAIQQPQASVVPDLSQRIRILEDRDEPPQVPQQPQASVVPDLSQRLRILEDRDEPPQVPQQPQASVVPDLSERILGRSYEPPRQHQQEFQPPGPPQWMDQGVGPQVDLRPPSGPPQSPWAQLGLG